VIARVIQQKKGGNAMKKWLRRLGYLLFGLLILIIIFGTGAYVIGVGRLNQVYSIPAQSITVPTDQASIEEGHRLAIVRACTSCHTETLGGKLLADTPMIGTIYTANLTTGKGGVGSTLSDANIVAAIRHGVGPDNKPLIAMPANDYVGMSDADVSKIIAYIRSVPPVDSNTPSTTISVPGKILIGLGLLPAQALPAAFIDHNAAVNAPSVAVSADYGKYMATVCMGCHNPSFSGGPIPFAPPDQPPTANLTPAGDLAKWSDADFIKFFHTGTTPEGKQIDSKFMPWKELGKMTDDELKAVFVFLKSLPAKPTGSR
jgi:mono/diheme cytochrome c family protein